MRSVKPNGANRNFQPPKSWNESDHGRCDDLQVRVGEYRGLVECSSAWKPDADELAMLLRGGVVELSIIGAQPPIIMRVVEQPVLVEPRELTHDEHGPAAP